MTQFVSTPQAGDAGASRLEGQGMTHSLDDLQEDVLTGRSEAAGEPAWLRDRRLEAYKRYVDQAWPDSRQDEYWRSTPFTKRFHVDVPVCTSGSDGADVPTSLTASLDLPTALVTIVDGEVVDVTVPAGLAERGVVVTSLSDAATDHPDLVRERLGSLTTSDRDGTGAHDDRTITANDAAWTAGAFIHVPAEVELDAPIGIHVHVSQPGAHLPRVLVVADHHAKATVYVEHTSDVLDAEPGSVLVDEVVEVFVGPSANVDLCSLQEWGDEVAHLSLQKAAVASSGSYRPMSVNIGGSTIRLRPEVDLVGQGAETRPLGLYFADEGQWFDLQPYIRHLSPRATSDVLFKGALQGHSRTVFRGNVLVAENAVGTDTNENNRSLILTDGARADSTPFLEILCSDITAGHGSATGQIDARHLYYLEARGIPRESAIRLIVFGFFREVLDRMGLPGMEDRAMAHIEREISLTDITSIGVSDLAPLAEEG